MNWGFGIVLPLEMLPGRKGVRGNSSNGIDSDSGRRGRNLDSNPGAVFAYLTLVLADDLRARTRKFALDVVAMCAKLAFDELLRIVRPQLLRSATGVAANYRAACRSRSAKEFAARLAIVIEEADESEFWLDVLAVNQRGPSDEISRLQSEAGQLRAIMARSRSTTLDHIRRRTRRPANSCHSCHSCQNSVQMNVAAAVPENAVECATNFRE